MKKVIFIQAKDNFERLFGADFVGRADFECFFCLPAVVLNLGEYLSGYDAVVTCLDHSSESCLIINEANRVGVPTVYVCDGTYDLGNALYNPHLKKKSFYQLFSVKYSHMLLVDISAANIFHREGCDTYVYRPCHSVATVDDFDSEEEYVLITTANNAYFDDSEFFSLKRLISNSVDMLVSHGKKYKFRIYDERLIEEFSISESENMIGCSLSEAFSGASALFTTPSTLIYSAIGNGIPVGVYVYRNVYVTQPYAWLLYDESSIQDAITDNSDDVMLRLNVQSALGGWSSWFEIFSKILSDSPSDVGRAESTRHSVPRVYFGFESVLRRLYRKFLFLGFVKSLARMVKFS